MGRFVAEHNDKKEKSLTQVVWESMVCELEKDKSISADVLDRLRKAVVDVDELGRAELESVILGQPAEDPQD